MKPSVATLWMALIVIAPAMAASGDPSRPAEKNDLPYGAYHEGSRCGCYGARADIRGIEDADKLLAAFYGGKDVRIGKLEEHPRFFRAEIFDANKNLLDIVIIDRRTGRIRSIY